MNFLLLIFIFVFIMHGASGKEICLPVQEPLETWVQSPGGEDPLEEDKATHSSILAWRTPRKEEPGRL